MKKALIICGLSALMLISTLTACGSQTAEQPSEPDTQEPAPQVDQIEPAKADLPAEATPEPIADIEPIAEPEPTPEPEPVATPENTMAFTDCNETVYATTSVNIRKGPSVHDEKIGSLSTGDSVTRTGIGTGDFEKWSRVELSDGSTAFVSSKYLSTTKPVTQQSTQQSQQKTTQQQQQVQQPKQSTQQASSGGFSEGSLADLEAALKALDDQGYVGSKTGPLSEEGLREVQQFIAENMIP